MSQTQSIKLSVIVHPAPGLSGTVEVPGDKSIGHRVAMLAGLASGTSKLKRFPRSGDCISTLRAMESLGARSFEGEGGVLTIQGTGGRLLEPAGPLNCGNAGTSIRLLAGMLAGQGMTVQLTGDESLCSRPMGRIKDPLERMGAKIELTGEKGTAPITIKGGKLKSIDYMLPVASAQVKSCVLLAGLFAEGTTTVTEPVPTRDHTERLFHDLGLPVVVEGLQIKLKGFGQKGPDLKGLTCTVPGDFSSAAYWMVGAAARKKGSITVKGVGLNPRRTAFLEVLRNFGAAVDVKVRSKPAASEPIGDVKVTAGKLKGITVGGMDIPNLIDELPLVAVLGALAEGKTEIRNAAELRVKESDRIAAMAANLRLMGVEVEEKEDGMIVTGGCTLKPSGAVKSYGDHRMAMAMAILATYATEPLVINNIACVETSYPAFWEDLKKLGGQVE
ncbi:MAG TPA: 3-phosphoshikimate 1-carboxyvinyltransferase [Kiritimatiellia bacterium]|jgi:3-phosphoshikimate 1-carboxyvinyltransferase